MADSTIKAILSACTTVGSRISDLEIKNGQLIFIRDKHKIALDFDGKRTFYDQIEDLATESARNSLLAPVSGRFYFVLETGVLWRYQEEWIQITTPPKNVTASPLDVRCYFRTLELAQEAAASAKEFGSTDTIYFYGMKLLVDDGTTVQWYTIQRDGTLLGEGVSTGVSDNVVRQLLLQQLSKFVVIGPNEPLFGPCLWFDTNISAVPEKETVVYFVLGDDTNESDVSVEIDDEEYAVLNTDTPVLGDDGRTVGINVTD